MSNEINRFGCDAALTALYFAFEELALRQLKEAEYEREVDNLERKKFQLGASLRAVKLKLEQVLGEAARLESVIVRELERQTNVQTQELSKAKEEATEHEQQFAPVEAKCDELKKQNAELEKEVEELKLQDADGVAEVNTRKLLQELRFMVAQLEQKHRKLCVIERYSATRMEALIAEIHRRRNEAEVDQNQGPVVLRSTCSSSTSNQCRCQRR